MAVSEAGRVALGTGFARGKDAALGLEKEGEAANWPRHLIAGEIEV